MPTMDELKEQIQELQKQYRNQSKALFQETASELFNTYPNLKGFSWQQGTPGFCDGDPCYFRVAAEENSLELLFDEETANALSLLDCDYKRQEGEFYLYDGLSFDPYYNNEQKFPIFDEIVDVTSSFVYSMDESTLED